MAPVIRELQRRRGRIHLTVCATAQHRVLLDQVVDPFGIPIDFDLDVMVADQTLEGLTSRILDRMAGVLEAMASQQRFEREASVAVPSFPAEVTIWRLRGRSG